MKQLEEAYLWLAEDLRKDKPLLAHSIFSGKKLVDAMGLAMSDAQTLEFMRYLELAHCVTRTNKYGDSGEYFNVHKRVFHLFSRSRANKDFIREYQTPDEGFCLLNTPQKTYRIACRGRKCAYYLESEKACVLGNFFIK